MTPLDEWRDRARFTDFHGRRIAWWTSEPDDVADASNDKPWLLLIHGYPTSSWDWTGVWAALTPHFRIAALDMMGFGLSEKPKNIPYSLFHQADLQEALLEHLGVSEAHVFVHDYGVTVGQELLARQQERSLSFAIRSMVFLNGGLFPEHHHARAIQKLALTPLGPVMGMILSEERLKKTFDEIFGAATNASPAEIAGHWALINENGGVRILHKLMQYIVERRENRDRWVGALKASNVPLRLINGGMDPVSGAHLYTAYKAEVPNADAVLFDDIGHYPHTEAPDRTSAAFLDFHRQHRVIAPDTNAHSSSKSSPGDTP